MRINTSYFFESLNNTDVNVYQCGIQECLPDYSFGPTLRDHYILHYVTNGEGIYEVNNKTYHLKKGQGFMISPQVLHYYRADSNNPWEYCWVGFNGLKAKEYLTKLNITKDKPIFEYSDTIGLKDIFKEMLEAYKISEAREFKLLSVYYKMVYHLSKELGIKLDEKNKNIKEIYLRKALEFIYMNYSNDISVEKIANHVNIDRTYLYLIFKEYMHISPQDFLIKFRIDKACKLMKDKKMTIGYIAQSVGYNAPQLFSRTFKKIKQVTPSDYRKSL